MGARLKRKKSYKKNKFPEKEKLRTVEVIFPPHSTHIHMPLLNCSPRD